jgi:hypothetical protein
MVALIFDVIPDDFDGSTSAGGGKVASAPKNIFPITIGDIWVLLRQ